MIKKPYLIFSAATDITGKALAEALKIPCGSTPPAGEVDFLIGWGTKTDKDISLTKGAVVLNHPDIIRRNRNKYDALCRMKNAGINVAPFLPKNDMEADLRRDRPTIKLPCIARTNFHQGGENFIVCLTKTHIREALQYFDRIGKDGYFQNYIDVKSEYRVHVFGKKVISAARKVPREDMEDAYVRQQIEKVQAAAGRRAVDLDEQTLKFVLAHQAKKLGGPDNIIKSNTRGYKFSQISVDDLPNELKKQAIQAIAALQFDFGAVDCVISADGQAWVLEVNSGPGLEGRTFDAYVDEFSNIMNSLNNPKNKASEKKEKVVLEKDLKAPLAQKLRLLAELVEVADEAEAAAINSAAKKLFG